MAWCCGDEWRPARVGHSGRWTGAIAGRLLLNAATTSRTVRVGFRRRAAIAVTTAATSLGDSPISAAVSWSGEIAASSLWRRLRWVPRGDLGSKAGVVGDDVVDVVVECGGEDVAVFGVDDRGVGESAGDWSVVAVGGCSDGVEAALDSGWFEVGSVGGDAAGCFVEDLGADDGSGEELVGAGGEDEVADADRVQHVRVEQDERSGDRAADVHRLRFIGWLE